MGCCPGRGAGCRIGPDTGCRPGAGPLLPAIFAWNKLTAAAGLNRGNGVVVGPSISSGSVATGTPGVVVGVGVGAGVVLTTANLGPND